MPQRGRVPPWPSCPKEESHAASPVGTMDFLTSYLVLDRHHQCREHVVARFGLDPYVKLLQAQADQAADRLAAIALNAVEPGLGHLQGGRERLLVRDSTT